MREEIEKERRKSSADENAIKKMEYILAEKMRLIQDKDARNSNLENDIEAIRNELDSERKKSLVDEATIRKLETELKRKVEEANRKQEQFYDAAEKIKLTENEIHFLKDELENERRKSTVDQNRIKKFEMVLNTK